MKIENKALIWRTQALLLQSVISISVLNKLLHTYTENQTVRTQSYILTTHT